MGVVVRKKYPDEPIEKMIARFKRQVKSSGILFDLKEKEFYEKPSVARHKKKRNRKRLSGKR